MSVPIIENNRVAIKIDVDNFFDRSAAAPSYVPNWICQSLIIEKVIAVYTTEQITAERKGPNFNVVSDPITSSNVNGGSKIVAYADPKNRARANLSKMKKEMANIITALNSRGADFEMLVLRMINSLWRYRLKFRFIGLLQRVRLAQCSFYLQTHLPSTLG